MTAPATTRLANALTVDVEEHFQVEAFAAGVRSEDWPSHPSRVAANTARVLDLFARFGVRGTFFIVGWVAEREPALVRDIAAAGHELGCHSHLHRHLRRLTPKEFADDTRRALRAIEDAAGVKVKGYRAPTFSVVGETLWALEVLSELGLEYDSSIFPVHHDLYGMPAAPRFPFQWSLPGGRTLVEFPASTTQWAGRNLPTGGGGYLRILPQFYTRWSLARVAAEHQPAMIYFHPWEIDPGQPRIAASWKSRLRHYANLGSMEGRISALLRAASFAPMADVLRAKIEAGPLPQWYPATSSGASS